MAAALPMVVIIMNTDDDFRHSLQSALHCVQITVEVERKRDVVASFIEDSLFELLEFKA